VGQAAAALHGWIQRGLERRTASAGAIPGAGMLRPRGREPTSPMQISSLDARPDISWPDLSRFEPTSPNRRSGASALGWVTPLTHSADGNRTAGSPRMLPRRVRCRSTRHDPRISPGRVRGRRPHARLAAWPPSSGSRASSCRLHPATSGARLAHGRCAPRFRGRLGSPSSATFGWRSGAALRRAGETGARAARHGGFKGERIRLERSARHPVCGPGLGGERSPCPHCPRGRCVAERFDAAYTAIYGHQGAPDEEIQLVRGALSAFGVIDKPKLQQCPMTRRPTAHVRSVYFEGRSGQPGLGTRESRRGARIDGRRS